MKSDLAFKEPTSMGSLMEVWIVAFIFIGLVAVVIWWLKRKKILSSHVGFTAEGLQVIQVKRISQKTTAYVLSNGEQQWMVLESSLNGVAIQPIENGQVMSMPSETEAKSVEIHAGKIDSSQATTIAKD